MDATFYYWLTIAALLLTMLCFFRKDISNLVSCATIATLYASGLYGSIFMQIFDFGDSYTSIDLIFLLVMVGIAYVSWAVPEMFVKIFIEKSNVKSLASSVGEGFLMWLGIYICVILYNLLYENSTPLICTIFLCIFLLSKLMRGMRSNDITDEETDDRMCTVLIILIPCFFGIWYFNSLIGNEEILSAFGIDEEYHYTISASLIPTVMLFLPVFFSILSLDANEIWEKGSSLADSLVEPVKEHEGKEDTSNQEDVTEQVENNEDNGKENR